MKKLTAIYRQERNGNVNHMTRDYNSKEKFRHDLVTNGFRVVAIFTDEEIQKAKELTTKDVKRKTGWKQAYKNIAYQYIWDVL